MSATVGGQTVTLVYDPMGRLYETSGGTPGRTNYLYDGDSLALEYDALGTIKWRYFFGPNVDEPILADPGGSLACSNGTRFLHSNYQGSIIALADCWGNRQGVNTYDEYGIPGAANQGRFQYTGQIWLPELGMYYYKARLYSPTLGRFLQTDPIGYEDQINLYAYVGNDPLNLTDPDGKQGIGFQYQVGRFLDAVVEEVKADPIGSAVLAVSIAVDVIDSPVSPGPDASLGGAAFKLSRAERIAANAAKGAKGEAATAAKLGDKAAGKQVSFKTSDGTRTRADFVTKDKGVVETKTGNAGLTKGQEKLHGDIRAGREVTPVGRNARDAGLEPGKPTRMNGCSIDRPC